MTNEIQKAERIATAYSPRESSKVTAALRAMKAGPMTARALADVLGKTPNNVGNSLRQAIESDIVIKLQDAAGLLHYALSDHWPIPGYWAYHGPAADAPEPRRALNPTDPFGLVASGAGPEAFAPRDYVGHVDERKQRIPKASLPPAPTPQRATARAPNNIPEQSDFEAAIFSTGHLMISVGGTTVRLDQDHQRQLHEFTSFLKERS